MKERTRLAIFAVPALIFLSLYAIAACNLPAWGDYRGPYGDAINRVAVYERHATDVVNAIDYDYRGFDTLGEEFILFSAVVGVMLLLRKTNTRSPTHSLADESQLSNAVNISAMAAFWVTIIFGAYIALHGQLTPGGGFQGGVILATAPLLLYLAQNAKSFERITSHPLTEFFESLGAGGYALIGCIALIAGVPFLTNVLPLGKTGNVFSSGTIALISATVGVEVTAAFLLTIYVYLQEIIAQPGETK